MDLKKLRDDIIYSASIFVKNKAEVIFNKGLIKSVKGKKIEGIYHLYGNIDNNVALTILNTHLKINMIDDKLIACNCSCHDYKENSRYNDKYLCEHIVATIMKFYQLVLQKKMIKEKNNLEKKHEVFSALKKNEKIMLKILTKIKYIEIGEEGYYSCKLTVTDGKQTATINSIDGFLKAQKTGEIYSFNSKFIYSKDKHFFEERNQKLLEFLNEYIELNKLITKDRDNLIRGKEVKILEESINKFLNIFISSKIQFNYKYINQSVLINKGKINLNLYCQFINGNIIITKRNKIPIELNKEKTVFFYDGKIFLIDKRKSSIYTKLYDELRNKGKMIFDRKNYLKNLEKIFELTDNITFSNSMKNFLLEESKVSFKFNKIKNQLFCNYEIKILGENINFNEDIFDCSLKVKKIEMLLEKLKFLKRENYFLFVGTEEDLYKFLKDGMLNLSTMGEISLSEEFKKINLYNNKDIIANIYKDKDGLKFDYSIGDFTFLDINNAIEGYKRGEKFYRNSKNSYLDLGDSKVVAFLNLLETLQGEEIKSKSFKLDERKLLYIENKINKENLKFIIGEERLKLMNEQTLKNEKKQPKNLNGVLRDYQLKGYNWIMELSRLKLGAILADDMGLGKTIQTISFILEKKYKNTLIITPTSLIYNWESEFKKFAPKINIKLVHGAKVKREKILNEIKDYDVILTTYGTIKNDLAFYKNITFDAMVLDEGQNIKNHKAQITQKIKLIKADFKLVLSGTPIENNLMELWSIFDFIMPNYLSTEKKFRERFLNNAENNLDLKLLITPFILRRMKSDVLKELPNKIEREYFIEMTANQSKIYKAYVREVKKQIKNSKNKLSLFAHLTRLRELCLDPSLVFNDYQGESCKLKTTIDILKIKKEEKSKVLIFSQFTSLLKKFKVELKMQGINILYLDGSTTAKERLEIVKEFNEKKDFTVFLISLKAGGTGLNLATADTVIHLDPWWNPAVEDQATDRAYRMGQKNVVDVIKLITKGTIEEKILLMQQEKRELINSIIDKKIISENNINSLTNKEIINLLENI